MACFFDLHPHAMETKTIHFNYVPLFPCENLKVTLDLQGLILSKIFFRAKFKTTT